MGGLAPIHWVIILVLVVGYFVPSVVAVARGKKNALAILALNLFLGWTFLGWVAAFVWSLLADPPKASPVTP
jgi:hypothetical protein